MANPLLTTLAAVALVCCSGTVSQSNIDGEPTSHCEPKPPIEYAAYGVVLSISSSSCIDASAPLRDGAGYEWLYVYDTYTFRNSELELAARSYGESSEAHFLRLSESGESRFLTHSDFDTPIVLAAVQYLSEAGKSELTWLDPQNDLNGYSPVPSR